MKRNRSCSFVEISAAILVGFISVATATASKSAPRTLGATPSPFIGRHGTYTGLFYPGNEPDDSPGTLNAENSGYLKLQLSARGQFTGKISRQGFSQSFSGSFDRDLHANVSLIPYTKSSGPVTLGLSLGDNSITGTIGNDSWQSEVLAYRGNSGKSNNYSGTYTLLDSVCLDCTYGTNFPSGNGPAAVKVTRSGVLNMAGSLPDGTPLTQGTAVSPNGYWPLYVPLYRGGGFLIGWINFNATSDLDEESLLWVKPPAASSTRYKNGFFLELHGLLSSYAPPPSGRNPLGWTNGVVILGDGDLPNSLTNRVQFTKNRFQSLKGTIHQLDLSIQPATGLFRGNFLHPETGERVNFSGAVTQLAHIPHTSDGDGPPGSSGWFLGPQEAGYMILLGAADGN